MIGVGIAAAVAAGATAYFARKWWDSRLVPLSVEWPGHKGIALKPTCTVHAAPGQRVTEVLRVHGGTHPVTVTATPDKPEVSVERFGWAGDRYHIGLIAPRAKEHKVMVTVTDLAGATASAVLRVIGDG